MNKGTYIVKKGPVMESILTQLRSMNGVKDATEKNVQLSTGLVRTIEVHMDRDPVRFAAYVQDQTIATIILEPLTGM